MSVDRGGWFRGGREKERMMAVVCGEVEDRDGREREREEGVKREKEKGTVK